MSRARIPARLGCDIERLVTAVSRGPLGPGECLFAGERMDRRWLQLTVESHRAVIACSAPRAAGAGVLLALADKVAALLRGQSFGPLRLGSPSVDLDGRDPDGFRAVVTVPIRHCDGAWHSRPSLPAECPGTAAGTPIPGT